MRMSSLITAASGDRRRAQVAIRPLTEHTDLNACVALQREVWGEDFEDCVPPALLKVTQRVGGLAAGAFSGDDLLGFVYGITGRLNGSTVHWSHMLAVTPRARGEGIGRRLKEYQRERMGAAGVERIQWSFDPLVGRNAHLNLNHLGASIGQYVASMYPPMSSKLHGAIPVDRVIVEWRTDGTRSSPPASPVDASGPVLDWRGDGPGLDAVLAAGSPVRISVPRDYESMIQEAPDDALEVRLRTREYFTRCLTSGYRITGFRRGEDSDACYILSND